VLENRLEELDLSDIDQEEAGGAESKAEAKSQEAAVAKAATENPSHSTTVTFGNSNSGFQAGIINSAISGISFGGK
jgi:hypothetical protein